jgi:hypothetical protein
MPIYINLNWDVKLEVVFVKVVNTNITVFSSTGKAKINISFSALGTAEEV